MSWAQGAQVTSLVETLDSAEEFDALSGDIRANMRRVLAHLGPLRKTNPPGKTGYMTEDAPQYKPGDVANGHILTADGRWVPIGAAPSTPNTEPGWQAYPSSQQPWGATPQQVVYVQADGSNNTSLAPVTSLVSGLVGLFFSWIPIIGIIGWVLGPIALVFGILGLRRGKAEHKIMSWIGIACGALTVVICLVYVILFVVAIGSSSDTTF